MTAGLVVLIADNDPDMRGYVRRCVEKHGLTLAAIHEARDGREALHLARQQPVDLLITDGVMPEMDGFTLCATLRAEPAAGRTAVLVVTGEFDLDEARQRARLAGADGVLLKPFNATTLCGAIDDVLKGRQRG